MPAINPRYMYASERRLLPISAPDFDLDAGEESGPIAALDLAQGRKPKPAVMPQPAPAAPALPDIQPPARPGPVSRITAAYDTHAPLSRIGAEPEPDLRDYRGRAIEDPIAFRRDQYIRQGGTTDEAGNFTPQKRGFMKKLGDAAMNTFLALGQAHKANPNSGLGNLAAAIGAGVISGRDPIRARELRFNALERPQAEAEENRQAQRQAKFLGALKGQLDLEKSRADIERSKADTERIRDVIRNPRQTRRQAPAWRQVADPDGQPAWVDMNDPANAGKAFRPYVKPPEAKPPAKPSTAELTIDPESGMSVEEMADASYQSRGGDQYVFSKLPARTRQILSAGTVMVKGKEQRATQAEMDSATREWERAAERQRKTDLDYTRGHIRAKRVGKPQNKGASSGSQPKANLRDLESKYWR